MMSSLQTCISEPWCHKFLVLVHEYSLSIPLKLFGGGVLCRKQLDDGVIRSLVTIHLQ